MLFQFCINKNDNETVDITGDRTYTEIYLNLTTLTQIDEGNLTKVHKNFTEIPYGRWDLNFTKFAVHQSLKFDVSNYYCPQDNTYSIKGSFYSKEYKYIKLDVIKCVPEGDKVWADDIDKVLSKSKVELAIK